MRPLLGIIALCVIVSCSSKDADSEPEAHLLAVSPSHACALRTAALYCWGDNFLGQLGNGELTESTRAVKANIDIVDVVEVAAASARTCVRTREGKVQCWGSNDFGQIGDGTRTDSLSPVAAKGIDDASALAIDEVSNCVVHAKGSSVSCWGGSREEAWLPRKIEGLTNIRELRAGSSGHYCARDASDAVFCWSAEDGAWPPPFKVEALSGAHGIAVPTYNTTCALVDAGNIVCHNSESGTSVALGNSDGVVSMNAAGGLALCASKSDGRWYCWNVLPQMLETVGSPAITVPSDVPLSELVISGLRACALREDRQVVCADANELLIGPDGVDPAGLKAVEGLPE